MPLYSQATSHFSAYYDGYAKFSDRALKQVPFGNKILNFSSNHSSKCQKNLPHSNVYTNTNNSSHSKPKIRLLSTKSVSGKLFSKAKLISDSKRETFLSPSSSQADRTTSNEKKIKTIRFLRVPKTKSPNPQSPKKTRSVGASNVQNKVMQEYYIQPQNNDCVQNKNNNKSQVNKKTQEHYTVDYQEAQLIRKKNIFTSSSGQLLLQNLIGPDTVKPKSNLDIKTPQNQNVQKGSGTNYCLKIPKVISFEVNDAAQIHGIQTKNQGETSFFREVKEQKKPVEGYVSSFSRLILKDKPVILRSDELNLSNTIDEQSFGELSLMSKH